MANSPYKMTISLNVLNHLGLNLYSNIPAVLAEVIANAWDADATEVEVEFDKGNKTIIVTDNGIGMDLHAINEKYLLVGYEKRKVDGTVTQRGRRPMGRKGIGKLSLFAIADKILVYSKQTDKPGVALSLDSNEIKDAIEKESPSSQSIYKPKSLIFDNAVVNNGTKIIIADLKTKKFGFTQASISGLRKRLARRFSLIEDDFKMIVDGNEVGLHDRDYFDKAQFIFQYGKYDYSTHCQNLDSDNSAKSKVPYNRQSKFDSKGKESQNGIYDISGWIATAHSSADLGKGVDEDDNLNKITLLIRGKVAQEDILQEYNIGSMITKYMYGEIHADFLDSDDKEDITTSSRQKIIEDDPRYQALKSFLKGELKYVISETNKLKDKQGTQTAFSMHENIKKWFGDLHEDHQRAAKKLFGRINQLPINDENEKRRLFVSSILAFESLKLRNLLHRLESISLENLPALRDVFIQLDDLEANAYYQTAKQRLEVVKKLENLIDMPAQEKFLQEHLYSHLWLIDPSWERATSTEYMEKTMKKALGKIANSLTKEEKNARVDVYYATTGNKHVIIELKKSDKQLSTLDFIQQIENYHTATLKILDELGKSNEPVEIICVVGRELKDWNNPRGRQKSIDMLKAVDARIEMYTSLINNAQKQYQDYIDGSNEAGRIYRLIASIEEDDLAVLTSA